MSRPWMPFYVADYLADTAHLSAAESGAYLHLIMHYWVRGALPTDEQQLKRISRLTNPQWCKSRSVLEALFSDGWKHKRIERELAQAIERSKSQSANAKRRHSRGSANAMPETCSSQPPSQTPSQSDNDYSLNGLGEAGEDLSIPPELLRYPKHGTKDKNGRIYFKRGTAEFEAYSHDYREGIGDEPQATADGRWFKILGENVTQLTRRA